MKRTYLWPLTILFSGTLVVAALVSDTRLCGQNADPTTVAAESSDSFVFRLEVDGEKLAEYTECFGLGSRNEIEETLVETNTHGVKQKSPGSLEWPTITLRRAGPSEARIWSWRKAVEDGNLDQATRDGAIIMLRAGSLEPLARWNFSNGWPASLTIEGWVEELAIVHDGVDRVAASTGKSPKRP